jgi:chlorite dismutase
MFRFDRRGWDALDAERESAIQREAREFFTALSREGESDIGLAQLLGHKADLMLTHYARSFDALGKVQARVDKLALRDYLEPADSYVSILELGLYEYTAKIHAELRDRGLKPHSEAWNTAFDAMLAEAAQDPRNAASLWARIPHRRYVCFYPMNKKREGNDNSTPTPRLHDAIRRGLLALWRIRPVLDRFAILGCRARGVSGRRRISRAAPRGRRGDSLIPFPKMDDVDLT